MLAPTMLTSIISAGIKVTRPNSDRTYSHNRWFSGRIESQIHQCQSFRRETYLSVLESAESWRADRVVFRAHRISLKIRILSSNWV